VKALLDPYLFWLPQAPAPGPTEVRAFLETLDFLNSLPGRGIELVATPALWDTITREFISHAARHVPPRDLQPRVTAVNRRLRLIVPAVQTGTTWGVHPLYAFGGHGGVPDWATELTALMAFLLAGHEQVVVAVRLLLGRNVSAHEAGASVIYEKTRWRIHVRSTLLDDLRHVACVHHVRNLDVPWTARFDVALPDTCPAGGLAFSVPPNWDSQAFQAVRTHASKPTWVDAAENFWADPNTPGQPHHWDVFLQNPADLKRFGLSPINITRWGTSDRGKVAGELHHVPGQKAAALKMKGGP
jgi:hypothetical protein